jgi:hypothetical protein
MAGPYHGKTGLIDFGVAAGAPLQNIQTWTLTTIADTAESSSMGDLWQDFNAGLTDFNATAECLSQAGLDTVALLGSGQADVHFSYVLDGPNFVGGALISGITETASIDGNIAISYTIEGNDVDGLTYAATGGLAPSGNSNTLHGKQLHATAGVSITNPTEWSISMTAATADSTAAHATNTGRTRLAGLNGATATITAKADAGTEVAIGATVAMILGRSATIGDGQYTGTAICTGYELGVDVNDVDIITYSFVFTTAVVVATS